MRGRIKTILVSWGFDEADEVNAVTTQILSAMREPTPAMKLAGEIALEPPEYGDPIGGCSCDETIIWKSMIDAALGVKE